jgi:hypothetical protein
MAALFLAALPWASLRAELTAKPAEVDFGRRPQSQTLESRVELTNAGKKTVEITNVGADCSCTAVAPEKTSLAPGETTSLLVRSETRGYSGPITRRVVVQTSEGDLVIPVKMVVAALQNWDVAPSPAVIPPSVYGEAAAVEVTLAHVGPNDVEVKSSKAEPEWVTAEVTKQEGKKFVVAVRKKPDAPAGNHTVRLALETTDTVEPRVMLDVFLPVSSPLHLKPNPLIMPTVKVGEPSQRVVELIGWNDADVARYELDGGKVTEMGLGTEGSSLQVTLTPKSAGISTRLLRVYAGDRLALEVPVIVRAER